MEDIVVRVSCVLLHRGRSVLLQLRGSEPDVYAAGRWGIFGGHIEAGESPEDAALREMSEELGLHLERPLDLVVRRVDDGRERFFFAAPLAVGLEDIRLGEGDGMALIAIERFDAFDIIDIHREVLTKFFTGTGSGAVRT